MGQQHQQPPTEFKSTIKANDDCKTNIGITPQGQVYTWGKQNGLGQLGRPGKSSHALPAQFSNPDNDTNTRSGLVNIKGAKGYTGGTKDAGHSAILDSQGHLWFTGCDRWQQLGLGASVNGASGYTWKNGALWQETFQRNGFLLQLMRSKNDTGAGEGIRDVAIGGDHTLVLSNNQMDVFSFGKGAEGQLGIVQKPFVSSPVHSKELSSKNDQKIGAVCAIRHCSFTLDEEGEVLKTVGKCRMETGGILNAVRDCREQAMRDGLVKEHGPKY